MAWRAVTEADLLRKISGDELAAIRAAALADGQEDPILSTIASITDTARGYIATWGGNKLGPTGTLPERLIATVVDIIVVSVSARVAGLLIDPNDVRKKANDLAYRVLEQVAAGRFRIEDPAEISADSPKGAAVELAHVHPPTVSRHTLGGL